MKPPKRGRPPIGGKAMTGAERQARWRQRLREAVTDVERQAHCRQQVREAMTTRLHQQGQQPRRAYRSPSAKKKLVEPARHFSPAEFKVLLDANLIIALAEALAELPKEEQLAEALAEVSKEEQERWIVEAVDHSMAPLHTFFDDLIKRSEERTKLRSSGEPRRRTQEPQRRWQTCDSADGWNIPTVTGEFIPEPQRKENWTTGRTRSQGKET